MKRFLILPVLLFFISFTAFAQDEKKFAIGLGPEWNMNSKENFAGGVVFNFDYNLPAAIPFAVGLTGVFDSNFNDFSKIFAIESSALFRWYFLGKTHAGFFAQADLGAVFIFENDESKTLFMGGLRGGYRLPLGSLFFIEPYGRVGYPFMFGVGALAGIRF